jgi:N-hydroxyarylamine O-acetyltransferase
MQSHSPSLAHQTKLAQLYDIYFIHLKNFPFHNFELLNISKQHPVARSSLTLFPKKQGPTRGGCCYQSASVLYQTLNDLKIEVFFSIGRVIGNNEINSATLLALPATHVFLIAAIEEQYYLLDPGLGGNAPVQPIPIQDYGQSHQIKQNSRLFKFYKHTEDLYILERRIGEKWVSLTQSTLAKATDQEIKLTLLRLERFPKEIAIRDSIWVVSVVTDTGFKSLYWDNKCNQFVYSAEDAGVITKVNIAHPECVAVLLYLHFNITNINENDIRLYKSAPPRQLPKQAWTVDSSLDEKELERMRANLF